MCLVCVFFLFLVRVFLRCRMILYFCRCLFLGNSILFRRCRIFLLLFLLGKHCYRRLLNSVRLLVRILASLLELVLVRLLLLLMLFFLVRYLSRFVIFVLFLILFFIRFLVIFRLF